ncbi:transglycosylase domain-containing protein [Paracoccus pacificus]|uniref:peptidoglycan glycosyltransferase n=1 Tax=Paracoccus pacificus TaxID=1463598 RepID=A0ABW4R2B0_9RHOB
MTKPTTPKRPMVADQRYSGQSAAQNSTKPAAKPPAKRRRGTARPKRGNMVTRGITGFVSLIWRVVWGTFWRTALVVALIIGAATAWYYSRLPELSALLDGRARGSVTMLDASGNVFAWRGETFGDVSSDKISPALKQAVIATEDKRFYGHMGISPRGIVSAVRINLAAGRGPLEGNGGSTITQQVAKLLCLGDQYDPAKWKNEAAYEADCRVGSVWRKVKEVPFAFALEAKYSKDEILTIYMNRSYLGAGARGFEAASQRYFGKGAKDVNPSEAAMLAGLLKAPSYFAPTNNLQRSQDRANLILGLMEEQGYLTPEQLATARENPAVLSKAAAARAGGYFADWVMDSGPGFLTNETTEDVTILTTFDQRVQRAAERALKQVLDTKVKGNSKAQAAVVVMSADGAVRAMIGGRGAAADGSFNRATQALRQTGSSFKPFVYAAALNEGYSPNTIVDDAPLTINIPGSGPWSPKNYTRNYKGQVTLTQALAGSLNTATIRIQEEAGRDAVRRVAEGFGVANDLASGPALGLGVSESTLLEMTGAYAGIRNGGSSVTPYGLVELRIKGDDQPLIGQTGGMGQRVISEKAAGELIWMMEKVIQNGTGGRAKLPGREAAGKTGTTSSYRDAWFIGFTEQYVTGVWMGYDDNTPLTGVTGGGLPAEIWQAVMEAIHEGLPPEPLNALAPNGGGDVIGSRASPSDVAGSDPLAQALAEALGQGQAQAAANRGGSGGGAPRTPGSVTSSDQIPGQAPAPAPAAAEDPLTRALNEAMSGG